ncbi:MAG: DUF2182 domain-containing protein [Phycisphaerae bacterium]|nr:DUF2182 domain-containing protein [Phycisphaerae bacterium]
MLFERACQWGLIIASAILFSASVVLTIFWSLSMSAMGGMAMLGGWTMSMMWMGMPGQTWPGAATLFLGMWVVMMVAMMFPSLVPMLLRYRQNVCETGRTCLGLLAVLVGLGYFFVWSAFGLTVYLMGVTLAMLEMQVPALSRAIPMVAGAIILMAGAFQFTPWKARHLSCCRVSLSCGHPLPASVGTAWRHGLRLGVHCGICCAGLVAILLVIGVMDLRAMAIVALAITAERLSAAGERIARFFGAVIAGTGIFLIARATGVG